MVKHVLVDEQNYSTAIPLGGIVGRDVSVFRISETRHESNIQRQNVI